MIRICKNCKYWTHNGGRTSWGDIYNDPRLSSKLGYCSCPIEPPYSRLKNELNGCINYDAKIKEDKNYGTY